MYKLGRYQGYWWPGFHFNIKTIFPGLGISILKIRWPWHCFIKGISTLVTLQWRHNGHGSVPNHQPHHCILNCLFRCRSKKTSKICVTGLCVGNSPLIGEFPTQMASNAEDVSIWWCHHEGYVFISKSGPGSTLKGHQNPCHWLCKKDISLEIISIGWICHLGNAM